MQSRTSSQSLLVTALLLAFTACADEPTAPSEIVASEDAELAGSADHRKKRSRVDCDRDNGGITLPRGFCAVVVADLRDDVTGDPLRARHMAVTPSGDIFVAINSPRNNQPRFGIIGLRDRDGDGRADEQSRFSANLGGSGIAWGRGFLYFGANDRVLRFPLPDGSLTPQGDGEVVVSGLPDTDNHISKTVVLDRSRLFVNIGSASNACQVVNRAPQSPGVFPCPELPIRAGVWLFDARATNQKQENGTHYATGLRNMVALAVNPGDGELYGVQHGRDMLFENWPQFFTVEEDAVLPAEELIRIRRGSDNGWPYCYFDAVFEKRKVLAPEYGGDGRKTKTTIDNQRIDCSKFNQPLVTFGAHWAPNGMTFYTGKQFPGKYRGGAFVAFHGGFDRAPLPNEGFQVQFVAFKGHGRAARRGETFADGFAGPNRPLPQNAEHRPVGVTEGPDGSLYISDDRGGRIWRVVFVGGKR